MFRLNRVALQVPMFFYFNELVHLRRRGFTDRRVRFSMLLYGGPAQTLAEFAKSQRSNTVVGAAVGTAYGIGGEAKVNKIAKNNLAGNWLSALSFGFSIDRRQGVKVSLLTGRTQKSTGVDIDSVVFAYSLMF